MQGSIADRADQDQKRVVTRFTVRSGLSSPFQKGSNDWNYSFESNFNFMRENRNDYLST